MANIIHRLAWFLSERYATSEAAFHNRRHFLKQLGFAGSGLLASAFAGCDRSETRAHSAASDAPKSIPLPKGYPAPPNSEYHPSWRLTNVFHASPYLVFVAFAPNKD